MMPPGDRALNERRVATPVLWRAFFLIFAAQGAAFATRGRETWDYGTVVAFVAGATAIGITLRSTTRASPALVATVLMGLVGAAITALAKTGTLTPMAPCYGGAVVIALAPPYSRSLVESPRDSRVPTVGIGAMTFGLSCVLLGLAIALSISFDNRWRSLIPIAVVVSGIPWLIEVRRARGTGRK